MNHVINTLSSQETQQIISAMISVIDGLRRSCNDYVIVATHTGAQTGKVFTQAHTLNKQEVSKIELHTNNCDVIFRPSLRRTVLFLPYDAIETIDQFEPDLVSLYIAEWTY